MSLYCNGLLELLLPHPDRILLAPLRCPVPASVRYKREGELECWASLLRLQLALIEQDRQPSVRHRRVWFPTDQAGLVKGSQAWVMDSELELSSWICQEAVQSAHPVSTTFVRISLRKGNLCDPWVLEDFTT